MPLLILPKEITHAEIRAFAQSVGCRVRLAGQALQFIPEAPPNRLKDQIPIGSTASELIEVDEEAAEKFNKCCNAHMHNAFAAARAGLALDNASSAERLRMHGAIKKHYESADEQRIVDACRATADADAARATA